MALHTYGRQLNQYPHIHLSVTRGGLCLKHGVWRPIYFKKKIVEGYWRQAVIALLRESYASLDLPAAGYQLIRDYREWCQFLEAQFQRRWKIHFAKKTKPARQNVNYLGRYLKRSQIAASKLRHYNGGAVVHHDYDHRTQQHRTQRLSQEEMLWRYMSHIPSRHFKMVRYYGFLANRKRGELLPKVYTAHEGKTTETGLCVADEEIYQCRSLPVRVMWKQDGFQQCRSRHPGRRVINPASAGIQNRAMVTASGVGKICLKFGSSIKMGGYFNQSSTSRCLNG
ncbi:transposase [Serratia sp. UGAL515B_01]|uniref:IS91 family transposase n=1 Tax=Serratia sp. UGAL515B_01 TaxID=2986763 RepID=UPI003987737A